MNWKARCVIGVAIFFIAYFAPYYVETLLPTKDVSWWVKPTVFIGLALDLCLMMLGIGLVIEAVANRKYTLSQRIDELNKRAGGES